MQPPSLSPLVALFNMAISFLCPLVDQSTQTTLSLSLSPSDLSSISISTREHTHSLSVTLSTVQTHRVREECVLELTPYDRSRLGQVIALTKLAAAP